MRAKILVSGAAVALVAATIVANPAVARAEARPYIVLMDAPPGITLDTGADDVLSGDDEAVAEGIDLLESGSAEPAAATSRQVRRYERGLVRQQRAALAAVAADDAVTQRFTYALNGFATQLTDDEVERLRGQKGVRSIIEDELLQPQTDVSGDFLQLTVRRGAYDRGYDGEGITIGVIDSGIWPEHDSFADDGTFDRPDGLAADIPCEFGNTDHNADDTAFDCNDKLVGARDMRATYNAVIGPEMYDSARDADGHGTHVASTAAGNADVDAEIFGIDRGSVTGIAHRASVVAYKGLGDLGGFGSDLAAAINQAVADGVDVINYSVGSTSPTLDGADDIAFLFAMDAGVHVATSNGNNGPNPITVGSPASVPWITSVGASTHDRTFENTVQYGDPDDGGFSMVGTSITEASPTASLVDAEDVGNQLCDPETDFTADVTGTIVLCQRGVYDRVEKSRAVAEAGGVGMILHNVNDTQSLVTDNHWVPASHVNLTKGSQVKAYIDDAGADAIARIGQAEKTPAEPSVMAAFSSRGPVGTPASADIIRPDVTAPGVNILAGNSPTPEPGGARPGQLFQSISGTSMSSPQVAGLFALMLQEHPDWSPSATRSALMTTARQDVTKEDGATQADPFDMGAGHVDPGEPRRRNSMWQPGLVYDTNFLDYLAFLCGSTTAVNPAACDALVAAGASTDASDLNLASIADSSIAATTTLTRSITNVTDRSMRIRAVMDAPDGFDMSVKPLSMRLRPGETKSFDVTFDNVSASSEQWSFGSLTWRGRGYDVRSPIALKGAPFDAPAEVTGEGATGSTSFDVEFGYTGDYTAAPHGLAPEVLTQDSVGQDPDQSFDPSDEGNGATALEFDLSDAALFRLSLDQDDVSGPGSEAADLDVFVLDESGNQVAASTSTGTNELIELLLPDAGTYTVWIHGWQTGGEVLDFTTHSWVIPLTPGTGNLEITSAPTEAVTGTTGTIDIAWTGVDPDSTALGAVSHADGDGLLGLTLVTVVNEEA